MVWAPNIDDLRDLALVRQIDVALEWQWGDNDFSVRDMLAEVGKKVPVIVARNWRRWDDEEEVHTHGYDAAIDVPFPVEELIATCERLLRAED